MDGFCRLPRCYLQPFCFRLLAPVLAPVNGCMPEEFYAAGAAVQTSIVRASRRLKADLPNSRLTDVN